jgi:carbonic anhydrase
MRKIIYGVAVLTLLTGPVAAISSDGDKSPHWGYAGDEGPENWGDLHESFALCKTGKEQSPINIVSGSGGDAGIQTHYNYTPLDLTNDGHTVQLNYDNGSYFIVGGHQYDLKQFHFHSPSENTIDGQSFPLEMHLVHADDNGGLAVVAILFNEGNENAHLQKLWSYMPKEANGHVRNARVRVSANDFLPIEYNVTMFDSSLTTPPCSEGVKWHVINTPIEASKAQIDAFLSVIHENNRPVQPLNERVLHFSEK